MKKLISLLLAASLIFAPLAQAENIGSLGQNNAVNSFGVGLANSAACPNWGAPGIMCLLSTGGITGTVAIDNPTAGSFGEVLTTVVASGSAVSLTTATQANLGSIALTPGDWDVWASVDHNLAATTSYTILSCGLSPTTATIPTSTAAQTGSGYAIGTDALQQLYSAANVAGGPVLGLGVSPTRVQISATTTLYVVCKDTFTVSTDAVYGTIYARRRR